MPSACTIEYPKTLPLECVKELVRIVRERKLVQERAALASHAWHVQGYLQGRLLGDPDQTNYATAPAGVDDDACCRALESLAADEPIVRTLPLPMEILLRWLLAKLLDAVVQ
jgi:hypothetical protein